MWILSIMAVVVQAALLSASPKTVTINGHTFLATISNRVEQKVKGLMFRKELPADSCMIFLYNADAYRPIWMENCRIPLDVIWVNESGKVVEIQEKVQPCPTVYKSQMCPEYGGSVPSRHFIEFPAGTVSKTAIKLGDKAFWNFSVPDDTN